MSVEHDKKLSQHLKELSKHNESGTNTEPNYALLTALPLATFTEELLESERWAGNQPFDLASTAPLLDLLTDIELSAEAQTVLKEQLIPDFTKQLTRDGERADYWESYRERSPLGIRFYTTASPQLNMEKKPQHLPGQEGEKVLMFPAATLFSSVEIVGYILYLSLLAQVGIQWSAQWEADDSEWPFPLADSYRLLKPIDSVTRTGKLNIEWVAP